MAAKAPPKTTRTPRARKEEPTPAASDFEHGPVVIERGPHKGPAFYFGTSDQGMLCYRPPRVHIQDFDSYALTETPVVIAPADLRAPKDDKEAALIIGRMTTSILPEMLIETRELLADAYDLIDSMTRDDVEEKDQWKDQEIEDLMGEIEEELGIEGSADE